tara:strand:+ start:1706 stop:2092 length:387 start_codon:yes stop_codon:yes gene_type:complete
MQIGLKLNKYRSGLEERVAKQLQDLKVLFQYETLKINYKKPEKIAYYRPDFILPNGIIIEAKGQFLSQDRKKHKLIREQHKDKYDIRFVFSNFNTRIGKKSQTTYAMWCEKFGFKFSNVTIPDSWINE